MRMSCENEQTILNKRKASLLVHNLYTNVRATPYDQVRKSQNNNRPRPPMNITMQQQMHPATAYEEVKLR